MTPQALRELLNRIPFVPFRLHLSDGRSYLINRPELVFPGASMLVIGVIRPTVSTEFWDEPVMVANRHITGTEPVIPEDCGPLTK